MDKNFKYVVIQVLYTGLSDYEFYFADSAMKQYRDIIDNSSEEDYIGAAVFIKDSPEAKWRMANRNVKRGKDELFTDIMQGYIKELNKDNLTEGFEEYIESSTFTNYVNKLYGENFSWAYAPGNSAIIIFDKETGKEKERVKVTDIYDYFNSDSDKGLNEDIPDAPWVKYASEISAYDSYNPEDWVDREPEKEVRVKWKAVLKREDGSTYEVEEIYPVEYTEEEVRQDIWENSGEGEEIVSLEDVEEIEWEIDEDFKWVKNIMTNRTPSFITKSEKALKEIENAIEEDVSKTIFEDLDNEDPDVEVEDNFDEDSYVNSRWADLDDGEERYEYIKSKSVLDSDGFYTDYTMYKDNTNNTFVFVFGDSDIYSPEDEDFDHIAETEKEANEWFDSYNGFEEDMDEAFNEVATLDRKKEALEVEDELTLNESLISDLYSEIKSAYPEVEMKQFSNYDKISDKLGGSLHQYLYIKKSTLSDIDRFKKFLNYLKNKYTKNSSNVRIWYNDDPYSNNKDYIIIGGNAGGFTKDIASKRLRDDDVSWYGDYEKIDETWDIHRDDNLLDLSDEDAKYWSMQRDEDEQREKDYQNYLSEIANEDLKESLHTYKSGKYSWAVDENGEIVQVEDSKGHIIKLGQEVIKNGMALYVLAFDEAHDNIYLGDKGTDPKEGRDYDVGSIFRILYGEDENLNEEFDPSIRTEIKKAVKEFSDENNVADGFFTLGDYLIEFDLHNIWVAFKDDPDNVIDHWRTELEEKLNKAKRNKGPQGEEEVLKSFGFHDEGDGFWYHEDTGLEVDTGMELISRHSDLNFDKISYDSTGMLRKVLDKIFKEYLPKKDKENKQFLGKFIKDFYSDNLDESTENEEASDFKIKDIEFVMKELPQDSLGIEKVEGNGTKYKVVTYDWGTAEVEFDPEWDEYVYTVNGEGPFAHSSYEYIGSDIEKVLRRNLGESLNKNSKGNFSVRKRTALDGKEWWVAFNEKNQKYSNIIGKHLKKKDAEWALDKYFKDISNKLKEDYIDTKRLQNIVDDALIDSGLKFTKDKHELELLNKIADNIMFNNDLYDYPELVTDTVEKRYKYYAELDKNESLAEDPSDSWEEGREGWDEESIFTKMKKIYGKKDLKESTDDYIYFTVTLEDKEDGSIYTETEKIPEYQYYGNGLDEDDEALRAWFSNYYDDTIIDIVQSGWGPNESLNESSASSSWVIFNTEVGEYYEEKNDWVPSSKDATKFKSKEDAQERVKQLIEETGSYRWIIYPFPKGRVTEAAFSDLDVEIRDSEGIDKLIYKTEKNVEALENEESFLINQAPREIKKGGAFDSQEEIDEALAETRKELSKERAKLRMLKGVK